MNKNLFLIFIISFSLVSPFLINNTIPNSDDFSSHYFKTEYMKMSFDKYGKIPEWNELWYGGSPLLLFYPPLSYYVVFLFSFLMPVLSAYHFITCLFYALGSVSIYFLAKAFKVKENTALLSALFFSLLYPILIENVYTHQRLPTIISIPFFVFYLAFLIEGKKILSAVSFILLCFTHHLSVFILGLVLIPLIIFKRNLIKNTILTLIPGAVLSFPIFYEMIIYLKFGFSYTNCSVTGDCFYLSFIHIFSSIILLAIVLHFTLPKGKKIYGAVPITLLILYSIFSPYSVLLGNNSKIFLVLSFSVLYIFLLKVKIEKENFLIVWFWLFILLGIGPKFFFYNLIPFGKMLDPLRLLLFANIPGIIIFSKYMENKKIFPYLAGIFLLCIALPSLISAFELSKDIFTEIPEINLGEEFGWFAVSNCPANLVSLLPITIEKPIIDGWYPQARLLPEFLGLTMTNSLSPDEIAYKFSKYPLKWIISCKEQLASTEYELINNQGIYIYKRKKDFSLAENADITDYSSDKIIFTTNGGQVNFNIPYFPKWKVDGKEVEKSENNLIKFSVSPGEHTLEYK